MYCEVTEVMVPWAKDIMQLVGCEMPDVSSGLCWKMVVANIPEAERPWIFSSVFLLVSIIMCQKEVNSNSSVQ